jgi:hypothetical protein
MDLCWNGPEIRQALQISARTVYRYLATGENA